MNKDRPVLGRLGLDFFFLSLIFLKVNKDENPMYQMKTWSRRYWRPSGPQY